MLYDSGTTLMCLTEHLPYFLLMPSSTALNSTLFNGIDYPKFFSFLSDPEIFESLLFLYKRDNKAFTPKLLVKHLDISSDRSLEILLKLKDHHMISTSEIELDDEVQEVYSFIPDPSFIALLIFARELIIPPKGFYWHCSYRHTPYLS